MVNAIERVVVGPATEIVVHRAARRQILWQRGPLAPRGQYIHQPVDEFPLDNGPLVTAFPGSGDQRTDQRPLVISQVAWVA